MCGHAAHIKLSIGHKNDEKFVYTPIHKQVPQFFTNSVFEPWAEIIYSQSIYLMLSAFSFDLQWIIQFYGNRARFLLKI